MNPNETPPSSPSAQNTSPLSPNNTFLSSHSSPILSTPPPLTNASALSSSPPFSPPSIPSPEKHAWISYRIPPFSLSTPSNLSPGALSTTFFSSFFTRRTLSTTHTSPLQDNNETPQSQQPPDDRTSQESDDDILHESVPLLQDHPFSQQEGIQTLLKGIPLLFKMNDSIWICLYLLGLLLAFFFGLHAWLSSTNTSPSTPTLIIVTALLKHGLPIFVGFFALSFLLGAVWILLLGAFVAPLVWATFLFVPTSCLAIALWTLSLLLLQAPSGAWLGCLIGVCVGSMAVGTPLALRVYLHPQDVYTFIRFFQLITHVLRSQGLGVFYFSWALLLANVLLVTALFVGMYVGIGHYAVWAWAVYTWMLVWTSQLLATLHQMGLACMVHHGYFAQTRAPWLRALRRGTFVLFGTACRASVPSVTSLPLPSIVHHMLRCVVWTRAAPHTSHRLLPIYCALSGHTYAAAAAQHLPAFLAPLAAPDPTLQADLVFFATVLHGCTLLFCVPLVLAAILPLPFSWTATPALGVLVLTLAWGCFRGWKDVLLHVLHTLHFCYYIDLHNGTCHSHPTHDVFKARAVPQDTPVVL